MGKFRAVDAVGAAEELGSGAARKAGVWGRFRERRAGGGGGGHSCEFARVERRGWEEWVDWLCSFGINDSNSVCAALPDREP